jgi:2-methylisocitrate lyase-like PEP mutase family enzyme
VKVSPKACGHTRGRKVVSREEAVMRIKAAVDARKESSADIIIIARTDARQAVSLEESLWRVHAFADAGADALFIDALASKEEMQAFCNIFPQVPKMVSPSILCSVLVHLCYKEEDSLFFCLLQRLLLL